MPGRTWLWMGGGAGKAQCDLGRLWGVAPESLHGVLPDPLLTLVLGRHQVLDEGGELVENVVPSQA